VIRIANSCEISGGHIKKIHLPEKWLPRAQVMEYTRAFLLGRMAWSELDGLLLISGALGIFNREIVIQAGGYSTNTVGEDMELVVRIRRYMAEKKQPYKVEYIPDPAAGPGGPWRLCLSTGNYFSTGNTANWDYLGIHTGFSSSGWHLS
jgi:cellulose synthase/poly-beta-1,6-N-acetylglucosamine synthase-like glycosyltransferase